jgi:aspartate dehydrogenase
LRLGVIGYGAIVRQALACLASEGASLEALICLTREGSGGRAAQALEAFRGSLASEVLIVDSLSQFIAARPGLVAEAAGHEAVRECAPSLLMSGVDVLLVSAGALADQSLHDSLNVAAGRSGARWSVCCGAVGGLDILAAAKLAGLQEVVYASRKPPLAWRGTPAERLVDLASLKDAQVLYEGDARAAARDYPQNANVAATIALAGAGFERTRVRLIADPLAMRNVHEIRIRSACADISIEIAGHPAPDNPKTSLTTGFALAAEIIRAHFL